MTDMVFPPPPKTVMVPNPELVLVKVHAYGPKPDRIQKVKWNPDEGTWEADLTKARWEKNPNRNGGYALNTGTERPNVRSSTSVLAQRLDELEARLAWLEEELGTRTVFCSHD